MFIKPLDTLGGIVREEQRFHSHGVQFPEQRFHLRARTAPWWTSVLSNIKQNALIPQRLQFGIVDGKHVGRPAPGIPALKHGRPPYTRRQRRSGRRNRRRTHGQKGAADGKIGSPRRADLRQPGVAVHAACNAHRPHRRRQRTVQRRGIAGVTVAQQVNAVSALGQAALCFTNHLFRRAFQHRGPPRHLPHKGHVPQPVGPAVGVDGLRKDGAQQKIAPAGRSHLGPAQALGLGVSHHFQAGLLAAGFHAGKQVPHLGKRQARLL